MKALIPEPVSGPAAAEDRSAPPGAPSQIVDAALEARIDRVVARLLRGTCVPFLGAGISLGAELESRAAESPSLRTEDLIKALVEKLRAWELKDGASLVRVGRNNKSLGEIAELCWESLGAVETCEALRLSEWESFRPTVAHRCLAMLIREGLIQVLLETNYDVLVERAVEETFGEVPGPPRAALVIHDLETYRRESAKPRVESRKEALVRVIKLNGCSAAYQRGMTGDADERRRLLTAQQIVLTEQQMQSWGHKIWARELMSVTLRTRSLLFIGFAGQDPIVRHHTLQVMAEFAGRPESMQDQEEAAPKPWFELENAPFVAAYECELGFYQYQILRSFREAHNAAGRTHADAEENTFTGCDGPTFGSPGGLEADALLDVLTRRTLVRLVRSRYLARKSPVGSYLRSAMKHPWALLSQVARHLTEHARPECAPLGRWVKVPSFDRPSAWAQACFAVKGLTPGRGGYRAFLESPVKQGMLLVWLTLAREVVEGKEDALGAAELEKRTELGAVCLCPAQPHLGLRALYATSDLDILLNALRKGRRTALAHGAVVILLGRGGTEAFQLQVRVKVSAEASNAGELGEMHIRPLFVIGDTAALRGRRTGAAHLPEVRENILSLLRDPEEAVSRARGWRTWCRGGAR